MKQELLQRASQGDRAAVDEVVRASWRDIRRICWLQLLDRDRAEEASQEAALKHIVRERNHLIKSRCRFKEIGIAKSDGSFPQATDIR